MLTSRQHECLKIIAEAIARTGISPSFDDIASKMGLKSKSGTARIVDGLEDRGFIRRLKFRAHGIEIIKMPYTLGQDSVARERERCLRIIGAFALNKSGMMLVDVSKAIAAGTSVDDFMKVWYTDHVAT